MKKLYLLILILFFTNSVLAEELYLRCIPEVTQVREGDLKVGEILSHRILYAKFKMEFDLTESDDPKKVVKKLIRYLTNSKGKKDKISYDKAYYSETMNTRSFDFEDQYQSKTFSSFSTMNVNYDGGSWVSSGNVDITKVENDELIKNNISWFGKCYELTKKQFKKRIPNEKFTNSVK